MKPKFFVLLASLILSLSTFAQKSPDPASQIPANPQKEGSINGMVTDVNTKQPIEGASVFVFKEEIDSATKNVKDMLLSSVVSKKNGNFSVVGLPLSAKLKLKVMVVGHDDFVKIFTLTPLQKSFDIGNAEMVQTDSKLSTVTVKTTAAQYFTMGVDRKIFDVSKSLVSTGQTAQEVLAQIPSVDVDVDGNVSLRGATPQIFIDGKPTTLTIDQIPSDIIDRVELITNPSAKYDASGGGGGIINIVLKKNRKSGYNGGFTAGLDTRNSLRLGGDFNLRQGKFNVFARGMYHGRNRNSSNYSDRDNLNDTSIVQRGESKSTGSFTFLNAGTDFLLDDNNTFTISGDYVKGVFNQNQPQEVDSLVNGLPFVYNNLASHSKFQFTNYSEELSYKHNFSKDGNHNISFDGKYSDATTSSNSYLTTGTFSDPAFMHQRAPNVLQNTLGDGGTKYLTLQSDYVNPITKNSKIEAGVRAAIRNFTTNSYQYVDSTGTAQDISEMHLDTIVSNRYSYRDAVYAAYGIFSSKIGEALSYQLGLRAESSSYNGTQYSITGNRATPFNVKYPISLFPSAFLTYNIVQGQDIQLNYSRKINRPNFRQLLPVYDRSDPYNISVGNPSLNPEFTNMFELSYDNSYNSGGNFLASAYYRRSTNLITLYQYLDSTIIPGQKTVINSYANASSSSTYGLELTNKITLLKIWDLIANVNIFNSVINASGGTQNKRVSWFGKLNNNFNLPANISIQLSGEYHAKTVLPNNDNSQHRGGFGFNDLGTSQGYIAPNYQVDAAVKKDWKWKGGNTLSLTASIHDIFATDYHKTYSQTPFMIQNTSRFNSPRTVNLTLSYRFGQIDKSLFKRKVQPSGSDSGTDMSGGGM
ncbi:outer membrane beta-barrel protein [Arachidicoccus sp.]|uniref:outer membrane beta-barrel protein n=1 Tax=Arachidicoccus sp. TaxID=1872624 RepID=UPI003D208A7A